MNCVLTILALAVAFAPMSFSQAAGASDPDMSGTWLDTGNSASRLVLNEKGDTIQFRQTDGDRVITDFNCSLSGTQCEIKEEGHPAKVMFYYNGNKLIEITERGSEVEKRRFTLGQDGKTMQMEIIPLSGNVKSSTRTFQKQETQASKSTD